MNLLFAAIYDIDIIFIDYLLAGGTWVPKCSTYTDFSTRGWVFFWVKFHFSTVYTKIPAKWVVGVTLWKAF